MIWERCLILMFHGMEQIIAFSLIHFHPIQKIKAKSHDILKVRVSGESNPVNRDKSFDVTQKYHYDSGFPHPHTATISGNREIDRAIYIVKFYVRS